MVVAGPGGNQDGAASPAADVLVADALQLPYRLCSCDGVLCIAVLHHISSRRRRVRLLQQLAALLAPGGKALVTVWATEQEDPRKTIHKWTKIRDGTQDRASSTTGMQQQQCVKAQQQPQLLLPGQSDSCQQDLARAPGTAAFTGPDYFVPWHLPFHKAGGLTQQQQQMAGGSVVDTSAAQRGVPGLTIDTAKGAVVLQRYYHLFEQGELEMLIGDVPGVQVVDGFYDRSNWCVVFQKSIM
jgi:alkylated DNA repair protein alkB family protein 8